jgi:hypothetical protein
VQLLGSSRFYSPSPSLNRFASPHRITPGYFEDTTQRTFQGWTIGADIRLSGTRAHLHSPSSIHNASFSSSFAARAYACPYLLASPPPLFLGQINSICFLSARTTISTCYRVIRPPVQPSFGAVLSQYTDILHLPIILLPGTEEGFDLLGDHIHRAFR